MKGFTIYTANCTGNAKNCIYPTEVARRGLDSLQRSSQQDLGGQPERIRQLINKAEVYRNV